MEKQDKHGSSNETSINDEITSLNEKLVILTKSMQQQGNEMTSLTKELTKLKEVVEASDLKPLKAEL